MIFGHLQSLLVLQKGLPLAYNRDLQEDKPGVFDALHKTSLGLEVLALTLETVSLKPAAMAASVEDDNLFATDMLEYLVRKGVPFSEAHEAVGKVIRCSLESEKPVRDLPLAELKKFSRHFEASVFELFDARASVAAKKTIGSTHPGRVRQEIQRWEKILKKP